MNDQNITFPDLEKRTPSNLVGLKIDRAFEHGDSIYLVLSDGRIAALMPVGDCCASAYIQHVNNPECLTGAEIASVEDLILSDEQRLAIDAAEGRADGDQRMGDNVVDIWGHRINTTAGTCVLDCRTEHNGYYGGSLELGWAAALPDGAKPLEER